MVILKNGKKTLVLGVSLKEARYSNKVIHKLVDNNHEVRAIGFKKGFISNVIVGIEKKIFKNIDTVTLYLSPVNQINFYDYVVDINPDRVIFNPGTENKEFQNILSKNGIKTEIACTLVLLSTNQY
jgi:predicted CoA-binding protein